MTQAAVATTETIHSRPVDPIDLAYLQRFTLGNKALEHEVLELFLTQAPFYVQQLRTAETLKQWSDAAHTLKGSARAVGAWQVARSAEIAEKLKQLGDQERRGLAIDFVTAAVNEVLRHIEDMIRPV